MLKHLPLLGQLQHARFVFAGGQPQKELAVFLALEFFDRPLLGNGLLFVKAALQLVVELEQLHQVRPAQFVRRRLTNWVAQVKQPHVAQVAAAETPAVAQSQVAGKVFEQGFAIGGALLPCLLKFHNVLAHLPVGVDQDGVDRLRGASLALVESARNLRQQLLVARVVGVGAVGGVGVQFHTIPIFFRCSPTLADSASTSSASAGSGVA